MIGGLSVAYRWPGSGHVPAEKSLIAAAGKELGELPSDEFVGGVSQLRAQVDFTKEGLEPAQLEAFLAEALEASKKKEPIIESGNKYGVSQDFHRMNRELLMHEVTHSSL